ncbi:MULTISPECIES: YaaR family protein [Niallia]|uniref:YaaR family protein n=1 Tax=Niallia TaxID=2837506 RepID=UPI00030E6408|nr:YaaR family protein [Niallia circulans]NRG26040.1 YaaR family protein [Niallia circulans]QJX60257.1 YaaR family protein [Niallia circulans]
MKINKDIRINPEGNRLETKGSLGASKFQGYVQQQNEKLKVDQLQNLMKNIDDIGNRLGRSQNLKDLTKYKSLVKQFVKEAVEFGMKVKKDNSWDQFGQGRDLRVVQVIDDKLVELTEEVIATEKNGINILDKIGEIKGLLINIYT